jgi:signal transduction histidine kinase
MAVSLPTALQDALKRVIDVLPDPAWVLDAQGRAVLRNAAARDQLPDGLGHVGHDDAPDTPHSSCPDCQARVAVEEGRQLRWHVAVPRPGREGAVDYHEVSLFPIHDDRGGVAGLLRIVRDVTAKLGLEHYLIGEAERHEEEVRRRRDEVQLLEAKADDLRRELGELRAGQEEVLYRDRLIALGRLVAGVAHEIHTPLGAVLSSTDLLRRSIRKISENIDALDDGGDDGSKRECLQRLRSLDDGVGVVAEGSGRIEAVLRSLRLYARLDEAPLKEVDLHQGIDSTLDLLRYRMGDRIRVVRRYGEIPALTCRPDALNQVFMNLLFNAVQAIPDRGTIEIRSGVDGGYVQVEISDDGVGIAEADLPRIFDLGFTTKERGQGSGMGLSISRRIVSDHGGTLEARSGSGRGTVFVLRLPVEREEEGA